MVPERPNKRRRLLPPSDSSFQGLSDSDTPASDILQDDNYLTTASKWNLEQVYEKGPRNLDKKTKEGTRLPIKIDGRVEHVSEPLAETDEDGDSLPNSTEGEESDHGGAPHNSQKSEQEQILEAKADLAQLALSITQGDPEEHYGVFKSLERWAQSPNHIVKQLALGTQLAVFKDVIPGYRIKPLGEGELTEKVSKEVKRRRAFEQSLVRSYKSYIDLLGKCTTHKGRQNKSEKGQAVARIAISCTCELLLAVPHFNFRNELLKIVANRLSQRSSDEQCARCRSTISTLFREDEDGHASLEAVTILTRMIKEQDYNIDESVLDTFLDLRLLTEFSSKASKDSVDNEAGTKDRNMKKKREFRTKKQRKTLRELKAVEKDFADAEAGARCEQRDRYQGETLKLLFGTYFRILKARSPNLTGAVLEGLTKFMHLINQDFFGVRKVLVYPSPSDMLTSCRISSRSFWNSLKTLRHL